MKQGISSKRQGNVLGLALIITALALACLGGCSTATIPEQSHAEKGKDAVEIRRTTDGIPHVKAENWRGLGYGYGYAQAQDALCTLADGFATFRGSRSYYFGADERPQSRSTFGQASNLELDVFFKAFVDDQVVAKFREQQPREMDELTVGFAEGYNRYAREASRQEPVSERPACAQEPWVMKIDANDIYRRMYAANLAAGYARFIPEIVKANPAGTPSSANAKESLHSRLAYSIGDAPELGSNMLAFGKIGTGEENGVLFGNPHWYWGGPDRFYQAHLTIPGKFNVAGVSFLGVPIVMIGFNENVAWSHTVSAARRFGLFELKLDETDPTRYLVDGVAEKMTAVPVKVEVRGEDGKIETVTRTLYRTRYGPVIDLGGQHPAFGWGKKSALAIRDINAENYRSFRNFFLWNKAASLDEFMAIQRRESAMPWVNTAAIGRDDGRVWYADMGSVPNVPDTLRAACASSLSSAFSKVDKRTPVLDGSRSACNWKIDDDAVQPGAMAAADMPTLLRDDYVANMNDSYWLTNPDQPLEGFAGILGGEGEPLSMRAREGHRIAHALMLPTSTSASTSSSMLAARLRTEVLSARAYTADHFKSTLLSQACSAADSGFYRVAVSLDAEKEGGNEERMVDLKPACEILMQWGNRAWEEDRGVLLWDVFWTHVSKIPAEELYRTPFSRNAPLQTPRQPNGSDPRVVQALAMSIEDLREQGVELDAPLGSQRFTSSHAHQVPLYGGCHGVGYFTVACNVDRSNRMGRQSQANSYLQVVHFGPQGVEAHTLLAHGLSDTALSEHEDGQAGDSAVLRYARREWLRFPFHEKDIAGDPTLKRQTLFP